MQPLKTTYTKTDAKIFSEGNSALENILCYCLDNHIATNACCAGHKNENKKPYVSFLITDHSSNFVAHCLEHKFVKQNFVNASLIFVDYPNLKKATLGIHLKCANDDFELLSQEFFVGLKQMLLEFKNQKAISSKYIFFEKLKTKFCRFELNFTGGNLEKMYIQTPQDIKVFGFKSTKTKLLVLYEKQKNVTLQSVEEDLLK